MQSRSEFTEERSTRVWAAAISGITSWAVFYPLDVVKNKMQVDVTRQTHKSTYSYCSSVCPCVCLSICVPIYVSSHQSNT